VTKNVSVNYVIKLHLYTQVHYFVLLKFVCSSNSALVGRSCETVLIRFDVLKWWGISLNEWVTSKFSRRNIIRVPVG
jgi:hypothetical protein